MFHTKILQNLIINEDFEKKRRGGGGCREGTNSQFFQKVEIIFENQRLSELFDSIRTCV